MTAEPKTVKAHERVTALIEDYVARHTYGGYPVERDGEVVGPSRCAIPARFSPRIAHERPWSRS